MRPRGATRRYVFIDPVLRILADAGKPLTRKEIKSRIPELVDFSEEELRALACEKGKSRGITKWSDRTGWAISYAGTQNGKSPGFQNA